MLTLKNSRSVSLLLVFFLFFSVASAQHPFLGKKRADVNSASTSRPAFGGRVTSPDTSGFGGEPGVVWERAFSELYPGGLNYYAFNTVKLTDGNFLSNGYINYGNNSSVNSLIKFSGTGNVLLNVSESPGEGVLFFAYATLDTGWLSISEKDTVINGFNSLRRQIKKYNKYGQREWTRYVSDSALTENETVISYEDKSCLVAYYQMGDGISYTCNNFNAAGQFKCISLLKLDSMGNVLWRKKIFSQSNYNYSIGSLKAVKDGTSFFLIGTYRNVNSDSSHCWNINGANSDIFCAKSDTSGNEIFIKRYGGKKDDETVWFGASLSSTEGGVVIAGTTSSNDGDLTGVRADTTTFDTWIFHVNDTGLIKFNQVVDLADDVDFGLHAIQIEDSSYIISSGVSDGSDFYGYLTGMNKSGLLQWKRLISGAYFLEIQSIDEDIIFSKHFSSEQDGSFGRIGASSYITGTVYYDLNKNNLKDPNEPYANKFLVTSTKAGYSRSSVAQNGWFRNDVDTGTYKTTVALSNDYYVSVPAEKQTIFTSLFQKDTVHFALQPLAGKRDLSVNLIPLTPARPGFNAKYKLTFRNNGTDTISNGGVLLVKDSKTTLVSASPAAGVVTGDSILWAYAGLKPVDSYSIDVELKLAAPPTLNNGDTLRYKAFITSVTGGTAGVDLTPMDDTSFVAQLVTGAFDPNDKQENVAGKIPLAKITSGEDIQYVIRFQNTGTDTAFTVRITDTLDTKLNWNTLQMTAASHAYKMKVEDANKVTWIFDNILLPDSNINEPLSHGYIAFRIKAKTTLGAGDYFQNKASIYFDYNLPIVTNTATTVVSSATVTGIRNVRNDEMKIVALPNPSNGNLYMKISGKLIGKFEYSVIDLYGRVLQTQTIERSGGQDTQLVPLQLNTIGAGVYYIVLQQKEKLWQQKIIVQ